MLLLPVGICTLAAHLVGTTQFAVIGGEDHDCRVVQVVCLYFFEKPNQMTVAVPDAVKIIICKIFHRLSSFGH